MNIYTIEGCEEYSNMHNKIDNIMMMKKKNIVFKYFSYYNLNCYHFILYILFVDLICKMKVVILTRIFLFYYNF